MVLRGVLKFKQQWDKGIDLGPVNSGTISASGVGANPDPEVWSLASWLFSNSKKDRYNSETNSPPEKQTN